MGGREVMAWWVASWLVGGAGGAGTCGAGQQRRILESVPECGVRGDLVDLAKLISLANITRQLGMVGEEGTPSFSLFNRVLPYQVRGHSAPM